MLLRSLCFVLFALIMPLGAMAGELTVSAAASLTNAFGELGKAFYAKTGDTVHLNFGASTALLQQMRAGAPVDVFASADEETMNLAENDGLINSAKRHNFAGNSLVLIVPMDSEVKDLAGLTHATSMAFGNPAIVPAGRYAKQALESMQMYDTWKGAAILAGNVRQVLDYVSRGEVETGIVFGTDAKQAAEKVRVVATLQGHKSIIYPVASLKGAAQPELANTFMNFLLSPEGQTILAKYGFSPAP